MLAVSSETSKSAPVLFHGTEAAAFDNSEIASPVHGHSVSAFDHARVAQGLWILGWLL